ncbi:glycoside hydrolase family 51 protein [Amanita thiersii Skay4041]|uniref:non-reducing end alpha-L-arabinofuranosidase n=1 Tax=Amanita thiersii Skay4041 TaxID=703135 RepID=A0A2A9NS29_9AGAR|nr:glycoside hydrolase family 51 protein [Amanita thiersii Skay4041]
MRFDLALLSLLAIVTHDIVGAVTVQISATPSHSIPSTLSYIHIVTFWQSGDGGLYAELLQNRAFQQVTPGSSSALTGWQSLNGGLISVIRETVPVSSALPNALHLSIPSGRQGSVGFANTGYFGIKVTAGTTYQTSFFYRFPASSSFSGTLTVGLQTTSGQVLATSRVTISGSQTSWKQVTTTLTPSTSSSSTANLFTIALDGSAAAGQNVNFALLSLFPPTFKNRPNGMRIDVAQALMEAGPSFWRFPGGNNLEGQTVASRWQWNNSVGPLLDRPGRAGDWGYINTDGLGLLEYLNWCEDLNMQPIMAVWAGFALGGTSVAENQLGPFIQEAIDQINFVIGDPAQSAPAALRASLGHPEPFALTYVEIGNEDFFASSSYTYRWHDFVTALKNEFPQLHFIATTNTFNPILSPNPTEYDVHVYQTPTWFAQNSFFYDGFQRNGTKYFEGEYAAISTNPNDIFGTPADGRLVFPTMQSASGEAAFMTGLERNSDIVFAASYAPLLNHVTNSQWTPNLVSFDSGAVYRSTSYYVQKLFSLNRGDQYLPSTLPSRTGTLFWSVVRKTSTNEIIIKVSNTVSTAASLTFALPSSFSTVATSGIVQVLTGAATASNTPTAPNTIVPVTSSISTGKTFNYNAPGFSVSVITLVAH